jgi:hypothetical protein
MYPRQSRSFPTWLAVIVALLLVFGGYYIWRGLMAFFESSGDITAPATYAAFANQTATVDAQTEVPTLDFTQPLNITTTPQRVCQDFRVKPVRARVRECPKETCGTITMPSQGMKICVFGVASDDPEWYEVNLKPDDPIPQIGYMHNSVLDPMNPTKRPTNTFTPLPTVTDVPSATPTRTPTPLPTKTPNPAAPATWTLTPTPTPVPPIQQAQRERLWRI